MSQLQKFGSPFFIRQFFGNDGAPLAFGAVRFRLTGTVTSVPSYTTHELSVANADPLILDAYGRPPSGVFLGPNDAYDVAIATSAGTLGSPIDTITAYVDPSTLIWNNIGQRMTLGSKAVNSGYQVLNTDEMISLFISGSPLPTVGVVLLDDVSKRSLPLIIKNAGTRPMALSPKPGQTIDGLGPENPYVLPVSPGTQRYPTVMLVPDRVSTYYIVMSHMPA